ncbi:hypothetical protein [Fictibacillus sp. FJAT-27399]|uniref:hypothetical protein n=1 Tax=Fictibacillus sp. FJAT-27399 TaxID=1729689 RepID=UPI0012E365C0|nr:hypothetical protein [Fictibacillus sp. FJAT-27399]
MISVSGCSLSARGNVSTLRLWVSPVPLLPQESRTYTPINLSMKALYKYYPKTTIF